MAQGADPVAATQAIGVVEIVGVVVQENELEWLLYHAAAEIRQVVIVAGINPAGGREGDAGEFAAYGGGGFGAAIAVRALQAFEVDGREAGETFLPENAAHVD